MMYLSASQLTQRLNFYAHIAKAQLQVYPAVYFCQILSSQVISNAGENHINILIDPILNNCNLASSSGPISLFNLLFQRFQILVCTRITYLQRLRFGRSGMEPSNLTGITDNSNTISHFILCSINIPLLRPFGSSSNPPTQLMIFSPSPLGKQMGSLALIPFVFLLLKKMP